MYPLIAFGSLFFWIGLFVVAILEGILLYNNKNKMSLFSILICVSVGLVFIDNWPTFNWKLVLIYPALAAIWLLVYWILELKKGAANVKASIIREGSPTTWNELSENLRYHRFIESDPESNSYKVNIKHPHKSDLAANAIFWPVSIPLFFCDSFIRYTIDVLTEWMEELRKSINESVMKSLGLRD